MRGWLRTYSTLPDREDCKGVVTTIRTETALKPPDKRDGGPADRMHGMEQDDGLSGRHLPRSSEQRGTACRERIVPGGRSPLSITRGERRRQRRALILFHPVHPSCFRRFAYPAVSSLFSVQSLFRPPKACPIAMRARVVSPVLAVTPFRSSARKDPPLNPRRRYRSRILAPIRAESAARSRARWFAPSRSRPEP